MSLDSMFPNLSKLGQNLKFRALSTSKLYTKNHEWIKILKNESNSTGHKPLIKVIMGITDYSQKALGDIVFIEMPKINTKYTSEGN